MTRTPNHAHRGDNAGEEEENENWPGREAKAEVVESGDGGERGGLLH
jgi:hypothetical protein